MVWPRVNHNASNTNCQINSHKFILIVQYTHICNFNPSSQPVRDENYSNQLKRLYTIDSETLAIWAGILWINANIRQHKRYKWTNNWPPYGHFHNSWTTLIIAAYIVLCTNSQFFPFIRAAVCNKLLFSSKRYNVDIFNKWNSIFHQFLGASSQILGNFSMFLSNSIFDMWKSTSFFDVLFSWKAFSVIFFF